MLWIGWSSDDFQPSTTGAPHASQVNVHGRLASLARTEKLSSNWSWFTPIVRSQVEITCGGVTVNTGDLIIADEEGIVVIPQVEIDSTLESALVKKQKAEKQSLADWRASHEAKIKEIVG